MPDNFYYEVQKKLREKGLTYKDLEVPTGITKGRISHILLGHCGVSTRAKHIPLIADFLEIPYELMPEEVKRNMELLKANGGTPA